MASMTMAQLMAENAELKAQAKASRPKLGLKVSEKGAVSLYGIRRFPVTFYRTEWQRIFEQKDAIEAFIVDNSDDLKVKGM